MGVARFPVTQVDLEATDFFSTHMLVAVKVFAFVAGEKRAFEELVDPIHLAVGRICMVSKKRWRTFAKVSGIKAAGCA